MKRILPLLMILLIAACGNGNGTPPEQPEQQVEAPSGNVIDLSSHDVPLTVEVDPGPANTDTAHVHWNEEFGRLEVGSGERFRITITEGDADIARLKADLDRDMLRKHTIIEEGPGLLIYRSEFPDEDLVFVHFQRIIEHEGRTFVIESHDQGRFNETDIRRMAHSVAPAHRA